MTLGCDILLHPTMFKGVFMSKEINHWCVVCGIGYHACDSCNEIKSFTPWRSLTDTIEHYKLFLILKDYNNKLIDKKEARRLLSNIDLSEKDSFKDSSKKVLEDILKEDIVERKSNRKKSVENVKIEVVESVNKNIDTEE